MPDHAALPTELVEGFRRFRGGRYAAERARYAQLADGTQVPPAMLVACCDARSGPETVFDAAPGRLFVVRNVAGIVPVYTPDGHLHAASAALEFAVLGLRVASITVLGHGRCAGVAAALDATGPLTSTDFLGTWVQGLRDLAQDTAPSNAGDPDSRRRALEHGAVEQSLANLRSFPWIRVREQEGELSLSGAWFDIAEGQLEELGPQGWRIVG